MLLLGGAFASAQQDPAESTQRPTFFAGAVVEFTPEKLNVSRVVLGKTEKRDFRITPETKIEGKLRPKVRVTVRYVTDEAGETAIEIIVRPQTAKKK